MAGGCLDSFSHRLAGLDTAVASDHSSPYARLYKNPRQSDSFRLSCNFSSTSLSHLAKTLCANPRRRRTSSTASRFRPLPSLRSASSIHLPSFMYFSVSPSPLQSPMRSTFPPMHPSRPVSPPRPSVDTQRRRVPDVLTNPNSPYVPWDGHTRYNILRGRGPQASMPSVSSHYSRPESRSGARAPEPFEKRQSSRLCCLQVQKMSLSIHNVGRRFKYQFERLTQRITATRCLRRRRPRYLDDDPPPPDDLPPFSYSPDSIGSSDTIHTTSLNSWLAARRMQELQSDPVGLPMTLEEYERTGSWVNYPELNDPALCDNPACDIHALDAMKAVITSPFLQDLDRNDATHHP